MSNEQAKRDEVNRAATTPNPEQMHHAHTRALRMTDATAADIRAHRAACAPCAEWAAHLVAERKAAKASA